MPRTTRHPTAQPEPTTSRICAAGRHALCQQHRASLDRFGIPCHCECHHLEKSD